MRAIIHTADRPAWLIAAAVIAALVAIFILAGAGEARAHTGSHEFTLRCNPGDENNNSRDVWVNEGDDFTLQAKWHKKSGVGEWSAAWDTNQLPLTEAEEDLDFDPEHDEWHNKNKAYSTFNHTFHTEDDDIWEDTERYHAGYSSIKSGNNPEHSQYCVVHLRDDDELRVKSTRLWGDPENGKFFTPGEKIRVRFDLNGRVLVIVETALKLKLHGADGTIHYRRAVHKSADSTDFRPVFEYTVQEGDPHIRKISIEPGFIGSPVMGKHTNTTTSETTSLQFSGDSLLQNYEQERGYYEGPDHFGMDGRPKVTRLWITTLPSTDHVVRQSNGYTWTFDDTYRQGEHIWVAATFNMNVEVHGQIGISMRIGTSNSWRGAWYQYGSGSSALLFRYTVQTSDYDEDGIGLDSGGVQPNGNLYGFTGSGYITPADTDSDTRMNPVYTGFRNNAYHKVDGRPYITSTEFTSTPQEDNTYWEGEKIRVALNYSAPVDVTGSPTIDLNFDYDGRTGTELTHREAAYESGSGTSQLVFAYQVKADDKDTDGVGLEVGAGTEGEYGIEDGTIKAAGTDIQANYWFTAIDPDTNQKVNGSLGSRLNPVIDSVAVTSDPGDDGYYTKDDTVQVTVTFDKDLTITEDVDETSPITLTLDIGDRIRTVNRESNQGGDDQIVFEYTVKTGDEDQDGLSVPSGAITLNGTTTVQDSQGQDAVLTGTVLADDNGHKVDAKSPTIQRIDLTSWPEADNTYYTGEVIEATAYFTEDVTVTGSPSLALDFDGKPVSANYDRTNGSEVTFRYTVKVGDRDTDGLAINGDAITLDTATIKDTIGNDAVMTHAVQPVFSAHLVNGRDLTPPDISSMSFTSNPGADDSYGLSDILEATVEFTEDVYVTGSPQLRIRQGPEPGTTGGMRTILADYHETDGDSISFRYTVQANDRALDGLSFWGNAISLNGGTIRDIDENNANIRNSATDPDSEHTVNGSKEGSGDTVYTDETGPTISSVTITSRAPSGGYNAGDDITFAVGFNEPLEVTGTPQLTITVGTEDVTADYESHDLSVMTFSYTVKKGETDTDGVSVAANSLALNGGTIKDAVGNDANLDHPAFLGGSSHTVAGEDVTGPSITGIEFTSDPGADNYYVLNDKIEATVTFDEEVTVSKGSDNQWPHLELTLDPIVGSTEPNVVEMAYDSGASSGADMVFTYTVTAQDRAADSAEIPENALKLNGATIQDGEGNNADITHASYFPVSAPAWEYHQVDGSRTTSDSQQGGV